jgi:Post-segregation antitoxin CcdA
LVRTELERQRTLLGRRHSLQHADRGHQWLQDNQEAIAQYNRRVAEHGLLSDDAGLL